MGKKSHTAAGGDIGWWPSVYEPVRNMGRKIADFFAPDADAAATKDAYIINVELPGVAADDVHVSVQDHVLTVKGEKASQHEEEGKSYFFSERRYGAFQRSFRLPPDVSEDAISADFKDGILTLQVPKQGPEKKKQEKKIKVRQM
jgi:HSP20 family protein